MSSEDVAIFVRQRLHFSVCSTEDVAAAADAEKEHMLKLGLHDFALNDVDVCSEVQHFSHDVTQPNTFTFFKMLGITFYFDLLCTSS